MGGRILSYKNVDKLLEKIIYQCECELLKSEVRKSSEKISELILEMS